MLEAAAQLAYHGTMKQSRFTRILRASANDILDSLDMRSSRKHVVIRPGQSVEDAWAATGNYLRSAMDYYAPTSAKGRKPH